MAVLSYYFHRLSVPAIIANAEIYAEISIVLRKLSILLQSLNDIYGSDGDIKKKRYIVFQLKMQHLSCLPRKASPWKHVLSKKKKKIATDYIYLEEGIRCDIVFCV